MMADSGIENSMRLRVVRSVWRIMVSQLPPAVSTSSIRCCRTRRPGEGATVVTVLGPSNFSVIPDPITARWRARLIKIENNMHRREFARWHRFRIPVTR